MSGNVRSRVRISRGCLLVIPFLLLAWPVRAGAVTVDEAIAAWKAGNATPEHIGCLMAHEGPNSVVSQAYAENRLSKEKFIEFQNLRETKFLECATKGAKTTGGSVYLQPKTSDPKAYTDIDGQYKPTKSGATAEKVLKVGEQTGKNWNQMIEKDFGYAMDPKLREANESIMRKSVMPDPEDIPEAEYAELQKSNPDMYKNRNAAITEKRIRGGGHVSVENAASYVEALADQQGKIIGEITEVRSQLAAKIKQLRSQGLTPEAIKADPEVSALRSHSWALMSKAEKYTVRVKDFTQLLAEQQHLPLSGSGSGALSDSKLAREVAKREGTVTGKTYGRAVGASGVSKITFSSSVEELTDLLSRMAASPRGKYMSPQCLEAILRCSRTLGPEAQARIVNQVASAGNYQLAAELKKRMVAEGGAAGSKGGWGRLGGATAKGLEGLGIGMVGLHSLHIYQDQGALEAAMTWEADLLMLKYVPPPVFLAQLGYMGIDASMRHVVNEKDAATQADLMFAFTKADNVGSVEGAWLARYKSAEEAVQAAKDWYEKEGSTQSSSFNYFAWLRPGTTEKDFLENVKQEWTAEKNMRTAVAFLADTTFDPETGEPGPYSFFHETYGPGITFADFFLKCPDEASATAYIKKFIEDHFGIRSDAEFEAAYGLSKEQALPMLEKYLLNFWHGSKGFNEERVADEALMEEVLAPVEDEIAGEAEAPEDEEALRQAEEEGAGVEPAVDFKRWANDEMRVSFAQDFVREIEEKEREEQQQVQESAEAHQNETAVAVEAEADRARAEQAEQESNYGWWYNAQKSAWDSHDAAAKWARENSWGAWMQSLVLGAAKAGAEGLGGGFGERLGSDIMERRIRKEFDEDEDEAGGEDAAVAGATQEGGEEDAEEDEEESHGDSDQGKSGGGKPKPPQPVATSTDTKAVTPVATPTPVNTGWGAYTGPRVNKIQGTGGEIRDPYPGEVTHPDPNGPYLMIGP